MKVTPVGGGIHQREMVIVTALTEAATPRLVARWSGMAHFQERPVIGRRLANRMTSGEKRIHGPHSSRLRTAALAKEAKPIHHVCAALARPMMSQRAVATRAPRRVARSAVRQAETDARAWGDGGGASESVAAPAGADSGERPDGDREAGADAAAETGVEGAEEVGAGGHGTEPTTALAHR